MVRPPLGLLVALLALAVLPASANGADPPVAVGAAEKQAARAQLKHELEAATLLCGWYAGAARSGNPALHQSGLGTNQLQALCHGAIDLMSETLVTIEDPPDPDFERFALPRPARAAAVRGAGCPARASAAVCAALKSSAAAWVRAVQTTAAFERSTAQTINRIAGAADAGDSAAAFAQNALLKIIAGQQAYALAKQAEAGRAYAAAMRQAGSNFGATSGPLRRLAKTALSKAVLDRAVSNGVAASRAAARRRLAAQLDRASGTLSFAGVATAPVPVETLVAKANTITIPELAGLIADLGRQGTITIDAMTTLLTDLGLATAMCRIGASLTETLQRFADDVTAAVTGTLGGYLKAGSVPLISIPIPLQNCG